MAQQRKPAKPLQDLPAPLAKFVEECTKINESALADLLDSFTQWKYPRADLYHWRKVLDRFDGIYERVIARYDIKKIQRTEFSDEDAKIVRAVLRFSVFLMDHCANRSVYSSTKHLTDLLFTNDLDVLFLDFKLILRLMHRLGSAQNKAFISQTILYKFCGILPNVSTRHGSVTRSFKTLISDSEDVPQEWGDVKFNYYSFSDSATEGRIKGSKSAKSQASTPTQKSKSVTLSPSAHPIHTRHLNEPDEGLQSISLQHEALEGRAAEDIHHELVQKHSIRPEYHLSLLIQIRKAKYAFDPTLRRKLTKIGLLALASLSYSVSETVFEWQLLPSNPDLPTQMAFLLSSESNSDTELKIIACCVLTALMQHPSIIRNIHSALNASYSHGILMTSFLSELEDLDSNTSAEGPSEVLESIIDLIDLMFYYRYGGSMLRVAGIIKIFTDVINKKEDRFLRVVLRVVHLLDQAIYVLNPVFSDFLAVGGVQILVQRINYEVDYDCRLFEETENEQKKPRSMDYLMPYERASCLKFLLKFVLHRMQNSETSADVRNLIDSDLIKSLRIIFTHSEHFGSSIYASSLKIITTFIENEPTCYTILSEKGIPEALITSAKGKMYPSKECFFALINSFGAICLNKPGLSLLKELNPLKNFFKIFVNKACCECLLETESASFLGSSIDELMRHHSDLKELVIENVGLTIDRILTKAATIISLKADENPNSTDLKMVAAILPEKCSFDSIEENIDSKSTISKAVDSFAHFLENLFANTQHLRLFIDKIGVHGLIKLCLLNKFLSSTNDGEKAHNSLTHVFKLISDAKPTETLEKFRDVLWESTSGFRHTIWDAKYYLEPLLSESAEESDLNRNIIFAGKLRALDSILKMITGFFFTMADLPVNFKAFFQNSDSETILHELGAIYRYNTAIRIYLCARLPDEWVKVTDQSNLEGAEKKASIEKLRSNQHFCQFKELREAMTQTSLSIGGFFQGIASHLVSKRQSDSAYRRIFIVARTMAFILRQNLEWDPAQNGLVNDEEKLRYTTITVSHIKYILLSADAFYVQYVNSLILMFFYENQGLATLLQTFDRLWNWIESLNTSEENDSEEDIGVKVIIALKVILQFLRQISDSTAFCLSVQCYAFDHFQQSKLTPSYYHLYIKEAVLATLCQKWVSSDLSRIPSSILILTINAFISVLKLEPIDKILKVETLDEQEVSFLQMPWYEKNLLFRSREALESTLQSKEDGSFELFFRGIGLPAKMVESLKETTGGNAREALYRFWTLPAEDIATSNLSDQFSVSNNEDFINLLSANEAMPYVKDTKKRLQDCKEALRGYLTNNLSAILHTKTTLVAKTSEFIKTIECEGLVIEFLQSYYKKFPNIEETQLYNFLNLNSVILQDLVTRGKIGTQNVQMDWKLLVNFLHHSKNPKILEGSLYVLQTLLCFSEEISLAKNSLTNGYKFTPKIKLDEVSQFNFNEENLNEIFNVTLSNLEKGIRDDELSAALLVVLSFFLRKRQFLTSWQNAAALPSIFKLLHNHVSGKNNQKIQRYLMFILPHLYETEESVRRLIKNQIKTWFRWKSTVRISTFVGEHSQMAFLAPDLFVESVNELCKFEKFNIEASDHLLSLKSSMRSDSDDSNVVESLSWEEIQNMPHSNVSGVVFFILSELRSVKDDTEALEPPRHSQISESDLMLVDEDNKKVKNGTSEKKEKTSEFRPEKYPNFMYRCFLLQILCELVYNSDDAKIESIRFTGKPHQWNVLTSTKSRSFILTYLLNELLPFGTIQPSDDVIVHMRYSVSTWVGSFIVLLCCANFSDDISSPKLLFVRRTVLDAIAKAFRDASMGNESQESRYCRFLVLSELCLRLLTLNKFLPHSSEQDKLGIQNQMIDLMIEKNFVSILTGAIAEIDLNHPLAKKIIRNILRPIEKLANNSGISNTSSHRPKDLNNQRPERLQERQRDRDQEMEDQFSTSSVSDEEIFGERQETPDLYRNSALGMFHGDIVDQEGSSNEFEDEDEEFDNVNLDYEEEDDGESAVSEEDDSSNFEDTEDDAVVDIEVMLQDEDGSDNSESSSEMDLEDDDGISDEGMSDPQSVDVDLDEEDAADGNDDEDEENGNNNDDDDSAWQTESENEFRVEAIADVLNHMGRGMIFPDDYREEDDVEEGDEIGQDYEDDDIDLDDNLLWNELDGHSVQRIGRNSSIISQRDDIDGHSLLESRRILERLDTFREPHDPNSTVSLDFTQPRGSFRTHFLSIASQQNFWTWLSTMEEAIVGGHPVRSLGDFSPRLSQSENNNDFPTIRVEISERARESNPIEAGHLRSHRSRQAASGSRRYMANTPESAVKGFEWLPRNSRLEQETRLFFGNKHIDTARHFFVPLIINKMKDAGIEEENLRKEEAKKAHERQAAEEVRKKEERAKKEAEEQLRAQERQSNNAETSGSPAGTTERVTVQIRGTQVDITNMGVDKEYLDALPDELREEVLTQYIRENREDHAAENEENEISGDFLDALPSDAREEVLMQEAADRQRRLRTRQPSGDDRILEAFNGSISADGGNLFVVPVNQQMPEITNTNVENKKTRKDRGLMLFLDKSEIAVLLRLLFHQQLPSAQDSLHEILLSLCENRRNRAEIIGLLLLVLQDGNYDLHTIDRNVAQISQRAKPIFSTPNSHSTQKQVKDTPQKAHSAIIEPNLLIQQVIDALHYLFSWNDHLPSYFLTEHELNTSLRRNIARKSKGKENSKFTRYPVNMLLQLLQKDRITESHSMLVKLLWILSTATRPLLALNKPQPQESINEQVAGDDKDVEERPEPQEDTEMTTNPDDNSANAEINEKANDQNATTKKKQLEPPKIPSEYCPPLVDLLANGDCSSRIFQGVLATMYHLCAIQELRAVFERDLGKRARDFAQGCCNDLEVLKTELKRFSGSELAVYSKELSRFTSGNSNQTKLLRALKALNFIFDEKNVTDQTKHENDTVINEVYEHLSLDQLWQNLGECLKIIEENEQLKHTAKILLPLIESLMVMCESTTRLERQEVLHGKNAEQLLLSFTAEHRKLLNEMVRNTPSLMQGSFALLVKNPKMLDFDNKRSYFMQKLAKDRGEAERKKISVTVRRDQVFLDSYRSLYFKSGEEFKHSTLEISFHGEEGVDTGGLTREWFSVLARQMFNPDYALFLPVVSDSTTFHPNRMSSVNPDHLSYFKFVGRIIGKALYQGRLLDAHFSRAVYKLMLGKDVFLKDIEAIDNEYYNSLVWMLNNDITDVMTETFSVSSENFGKQEIIDLKPNGRDITVTEENKHEYVRLIVQYRLRASVEEQLDAFLKGFHDIIPSELISIFDEQELELLISGLPDIDVDDWRNNTTYTNYSPHSPQVQWFWRAVRSFNKEERAKLLQFATGTAKMPLDGFAKLDGEKFSLHRDPSSASRLPQSHTCFNQIDLPEYEYYEQLRAALLKAVNEGSEGFGFI